MDLESECECPESEGFFPHPYSCAYVCFCSQGSAQVLKCPDGDLFSLKSKECVPRAHSDCTPRKGKPDRSESENELRPSNSSIDKKNAIYQRAHI